MTTALKVGTRRKAGQKKVCEHCGASMMEYKHGLSGGLVAGLVRLFRHRKPINLKHLKLTRNQWDNFQKLRYWDLVRKYTPPDEAPKGKGGVWTITQRGIDFVRGTLQVPKFVWTYRGEMRRFEGEEIYIWHVDPQYKTRPEYAEEALPHKTEDGQLNFW